MKDKIKSALKCFAQKVKSVLRFGFLKCSFLHTLLSASLTYRKLIGGLWVHYYIEDGQISIWDFIPENTDPFTIIAPVYYALSFHVYNQPIKEKEIKL